MRGGGGSEDKSNDNTSSQEEAQNQVELSGGKHAASLPVLMLFGIVDYSPYLPTKCIQSDSKLIVIIPRKLWGDREEDEGLPSLLSLSGCYASLDRMERQSESFSVYSAATEKSHIVAVTAASPAESIVEAVVLNMKTENSDQESVLRAAAAMS
jgi:hypothetical protein